LFSLWATLDERYYTKNPTFEISEVPKLKENYNKPLKCMENWRFMLTGLTVQATQKVDMLFTESVI